MDNHKRILGILFIILAVLQILGMIALSAILNLVFGLASHGADADDAAVLELISKIATYVPVIVVVFFSIPGLIAGIALLTRQAWATTMAMIAGIIHILSFPFGTALGVYAIWVYFEDQKTKTAQS